MKIAPEHTEPEILRLMHKSGSECLPDFLKKCRDIAAKRGRKILFTPYFISAHTGCTLEDMEMLARKIRKMGLSVRQFQDFTPTPGTHSTAMFVTARPGHAQTHSCSPGEARNAGHKGCFSKKCGLGNKAKRRNQADDRQGFLRCRVR
jgi:hypothetical protein